MNIAPWHLTFKSIGDDWIKVVTGTIAALVVSVAEILPIGRRWSWLPWVTFIVIWSWTWAWAFVRSWTREHRRVESLEKHLLDEYVSHVTALHTPNIVWNLAHERDIASKISGDDAIIQQAIEFVKKASVSSSQS